jgi:hypothetical protein
VITAQTLEVGRHVVELADIPTLVTAFLLLPTVIHIFRILWVHLLPLHQPLQQLALPGAPIVGWGMENVILPVTSRLVILIKGIAALRAQMEVCAM